MRAFALRSPWLQCLMALHVYLTLNKLCKLVLNCSEMEIRCPFPLRQFSYLPLVLCVPAWYWHRDVLMCALSWQLFLPLNYWLSDSTFRPFPPMKSIGAVAFISASRVTSRLTVRSFPAMTRRVEIRPEKRRENLAISMLSRVSVRWRGKCQLNSRATGSDHALSHEGPGILACVQWLMLRSSSRA